MDQELTQEQLAGVVASTTADQREWLARQFESLTSEIEVLAPSAWAETKRYLPPSVTPLPGLYSFRVAPFIREILDCMAPDSPVREIAFMKAVQLCATTGCLENALGFYIDHVKTAPMMLVTADADLAQLRMESYITPMLQHSDLLRLIKSADETNKRKTGKTTKKLEWVGGGFLIPYGAQNANKLRSTSIQILLNDEIDGWPQTVGNQGDPVKLVRDRTAAYEASRKILDVSTPLIKGQSKIEALFKRGDQRQYFVNCLRCEHPQVLRWSHTDNETQVVSGMVWETEGDRLVPESVQYLCQRCSHPHTDDDKTRLIAFENAEWKPTSIAVAPDIRSYQLSALYSPAGMQSWGGCVQKWLEAWDVEKVRARDLGKLQVFYNNVLGESFELRGEKLRFENVSAHRRRYRSGEVPNTFASEFCGSVVLLLTCAVDVHKDSLKVAVFGWCRDRRAVLIEYLNFEGTTEQLDDPGTWGALSELIESKEYVADDGKFYTIAVTFVDSGYLTDQVYRFCAEYDSGVFPIKGQPSTGRLQRTPEFIKKTTSNGIIRYDVGVDYYKDRWSAALRRGWDGHSLQPSGHFNAPIDLTDKQLKELTVEVKREKIEKSTGKRVGFEWHRPGGAANELWDLILYANIALDVMASSMSQDADMESTNWIGFWDVCEAGEFFTVPDSN